MKNDSIKKSYMSFYVPTLVTCLVDYIGGFIDNALGGRILGEEVLSGLSVAVPVMLLFSMTGNLLSGGYILASQELGAKNHEKAKTYYRKTILLSLTVSVLMTALIIAFSGTICRFLCKNASESVIESARQYLIWFCPTAIPFLLIFVLTGFLRLDKAQDIPMKATIVITVCDIALDVLLAPKWGVRGLAAATTISYILGLMVFSIYFFRKNRVFALFYGKRECIDMGHLLITGAPLAMNRFGNFINSVFLNYMVFSLASNVGGIVINIRSQCMNIALSVLTGAILAGSPVLGGFYGEKNRQGQKRISEIIIRSALLHASVIAVICCIMNRIIPRLFGIENDATVLKAAAFAIICLGIDLIFKAVITSVVVIYQTSGREKPANAISTLETLFPLIPLELIFGMKYGINGLWIGAITADVLLVIMICVMQYRQGKRNITEDN